MGIEIERKFLVRGPQWRAQVTGSHMIRQGYLSTHAGRVVRVRIVDELAGFITVKGPGRGAARSEFEYPIPGTDAAEMLDELCIRPLIVKRRHILSLRPGSWVVDEFTGAHEGLLLAEVELPDEDTVPAVPSWADREVTADRRYANSSLAATGRLPEVSRGG